jgi:hypothetical protein
MVLIAILLSSILPLFMDWRGFTYIGGAEVTEEIR